MPLKVFKSLIALGLLHFLAVSVFATSCAVVPLEQELAQSRWAATNFLFKGFYLGLILAVLVGNLVLSRITTKGWLIGLALLVVSLPIAAYFSIWEAANSGCGYGGLEARNYLFILIPLVLALLIQSKIALRSYPLTKPDLS